MHCQERDAVELLESRHKHDLNVFYVEHIEVPHVVFGGAIIREKLAPDCFVEDLKLLVLMLGQGKVRNRACWEAAASELAKLGHIVVQQSV